MLVSTNWLFLQVQAWYISREINIREVNKLRLQKSIKYKSKDLLLCEVVISIICIISKNCRTLQLITSRQPYLCSSCSEPVVNRPITGDCTSNGYRMSNQVCDALRLHRVHHLCQICQYSKFVINLNCLTRPIRDIRTYLSDFSRKRMFPTCKLSSRAVITLGDLEVQPLIYQSNMFQKNTVWVCCLQPFCDVVYKCKVETLCVFKVKLQTPA